MRSLLDGPEMWWRWVLAGAIAAITLVLTVGLTRAEFVVGGACVAATTPVIARRTWKRWGARR